MRAEVETRRLIQGNQHIETITAIGSLAEVYEQLEWYEEAEQMWKEKLEICQSSKGDNYYQTLYSLHSLARFYYNQARYEEAEKCGRRS